jgi:pre-rRNA-processing protein TSR3
MAASLFVLGFKQDALNLLDKFKWGHTFYELNQNLLEEYSKIESEDDVNEILQNYGIAT